MKTLTLLILSSALAPAFALISRGARLESWPTIAAACGALAVALIAIRYLTGA